MKRWYPVLIFGVLLSACHDDIAAPGREPAAATKPQFNHTFDPQATPFAANQYAIWLYPNRLGGGTWNGGGAMYFAGVAYGTSSESVFFSSTANHEVDLSAATMPDYLGPGPAASAYAANVALEVPVLTRGPRVPLGLVVVREVYAWDTPADENGIIVKYTLHNPSASAITGLYAGLIMDLDLVNAPENWGEYDGTAQLALVSSPEHEEWGVLGAALLTHPVTQYSEWNNGGTQPDPNTNAGWFALLSNGIQQDPVVSDVRQYIGADGLEIVAGGNLVLAFALAAGEDAGSVHAAIDAARNHWSDPLLQAPASAARVPVTIAPGATEYVAAFDLGSTAAAALFDINNAGCGRAPVRSFTTSGSTVFARFLLADIDPLLQTGSLVVCAARLTDGTLVIGSDTPAILKPTFAATRVTTMGTAEVSPTWSPDGERLAFVSIEAPGVETISVLDLASGIITPVAWGAGVTRPDWSPDGALIAFSRFNSGDDNGIHTVRLSDNFVTQLLPGGNDPRYSPDGTSIVFVNGPYLWLMPASGWASGWDPEQLTSMGTSNNPEWSPDGETLYFVGRDPADISNYQRLYAMQLSVGEPATPLTAPEGFFNSVAPAPYGSLLIFGAGGNLYTHELLTGNHERLPLEPNLRVALQNVEFSPDGTRLAISDGNDLWVVDVASLGPPAVQVRGLILRTNALVLDGVLPLQQVKGLLATLETGLENLARGQTDIAARLLTAFDNQVDALVRSRRLTTTQAQPLLDAVAAALARIMQTA